VKKGRTRLPFRDAGLAYFDAAADAAAGAEAAADAEAAAFAGLVFLAAAADADAEAAAGAGAEAMAEADAEADAAAYAEVANMETSRAAMILDMLNSFFSLRKTLIHDESCP
jgi:hypothetical protein